MIIRLILIGIALAAGTRCAEAGLILDEDCLGAAISRGISADAFYPEQEETQVNFLQAFDSSDLLATVQAGGAASGFVAAVTHVSLVIPQPVSGSRISLNNATFPLNPLLDGLLKPS